MFLHANFRIFATKSTLSTVLDRTNYRLRNEQHAGYERRSSESAGDMPRAILGRLDDNPDENGVMNPGSVRNPSMRAWVFTPIFWIGYSKRWGCVSGTGQVAEGPFRAGDTRIVPLNTTRNRSLPVG